MKKKRFGPSKLHHARPEGKEGKTREFLSLREPVYIDFD